jgi:hypothetical protein
MGYGLIEAINDALHDVFQVRFNDTIEDFSAIFVAVEEATPLHQTQVFGGHGGGKFTAFCQFANRVVAGQEHLNHPQAMWMGQYAETFGRLPKCVEVRQSWFCLCHGFSPLCSNISEGSELSMSFFGGWRTIGNPRMGQLRTIETPESHGNWVAAHPQYHPHEGSLRANGPADATATHSPAARTFGANRNRGG